MLGSEWPPEKNTLLESFKNDLREKASVFGQRILDTVEFPDIDLENVDNQYHLDMLRGLLERTDADEALLELILQKEGIAEDVKRIIVESFEMGDISLKIGSKRNVDRVVLVFNDGNMATMTVSLDKEPVQREDQSPSFQEFQTLQPTQREKAWCVQELYGYKRVQNEHGVRGLICKEYLNGDMLAVYTGDMDRAVATYGEERMRMIARATGQAVANAFIEFGGIPSDSNAFNFIVRPSDADTTPIVRYCDVESIRVDKAGIAHELKLMQKEFGRFASDFMEAFQTAQIDKSAA